MLAGRHGLRAPIRDRGPETLRAAQREEHQHRGARRSAVGLLGWFAGNGGGARLHGLHEMPRLDRDDAGLGFAGSHHQPASRARGRSLLPEGRAEACGGPGCALLPGRALCGGGFGEGGFAEGLRRAAQPAPSRRLLSGHLPGLRLRCRGQRPSGRGDPGNVRPLGAPRQRWALEPHHLLRRHWRLPVGDRLGGRSGLHGHGEGGILRLVCPQCGTCCSCGLPPWGRRRPGPTGTRSQR
mmetsp:Transcript_41705/g.97377  ORF Transcript_41705/g.97377 Transcript_41705/m.97377 type:complete len:239 (-) Transcript_41705:492-1208(-)